MALGTWVEEITVPGAAALANPAMGNINALTSGTIVFTEGGPSGVVGNWGLLNPSTGAVTEIAAPSASSMGGICDTGDGRVAYSLSSAHTVVICNLDGTGSHSVVVGDVAGAGEVILGPDGQIWVAGVSLSGTAGIRPISLSAYTAGSVAAVTPLTVSHSITVGSDSRLYASCAGTAGSAGTDGIAGVTTAGVVTTYLPATKWQSPGTVQTCRANPADGNIYYARGPGRGTLGRMSTAGSFSAEWAVQLPFGTPAGTAIDAAGNIWVGMRTGNRLECYNTSGQRIAVASCPTVGGNPNKLAYANGFVYAAYYNAGIIGVIQAV